MQIPVCGVSLFDALVTSNEGVVLSSSPHGERSKHSLSRRVATKSRIETLIVDAGRGNVFYRSGKKEGIWSLADALKKKNIVGFEIEGIKQKVKLDIAQLLATIEFKKTFEPVSAHYVTKPNISKSKKK